MSTQEELIEQTTTPGQDDELCHVFCCRNEYLALCGQDLTKATLCHDGTCLECVVCEELDETGYCPLTRGTCWWY
jgi:hypothetical protein